LPAFLRRNRCRVSSACHSLHSRALRRSGRRANRRRQRARLRQINDTAKYLQLKIGRRFKFGSQSIEPAFNLFNAFNTGANTQWNTGANQLYNLGLLQPFNRHPPRAVQLSINYKF
jgi:hypothetical protein